MPDINAKFIAAVIVAAIIIGAGLSFFHETYNAKPYEKIHLPHMFQGETRMLAFDTKGSALAPVQNGSITLQGYVENKQGNPVTGNISIYDFPWVVYAHLSSHGFYSVNLLQYGSFTIGYKVSGYNTGFNKFTIMSGNSQWANVTIGKATFYKVTGKTFNVTQGNVPDVNLTFISFFGKYNSSSNSKGIFQTTLQNGTYAALTIKRNYNETPKPLFFNVTGKGITGLNLEMKRIKNQTYLVSGYVKNKLNIPIGGISVYSVSISGNSTKGASVNSTSIFGKGITNSHGYYQISAPVGLDLVSTVINFEYLANHSSVFFLNNSLTNVNISIQAINPFISGNSSALKAGTGAVPSFMQPDVRKYLSGHLSNVGYSSGFVPNQKLLISFSNVFYPSSPQNKSLLHSLHVMIFGNFEGTIYSTQANISINGEASFPDYYIGAYNLVAYAPGFQYTTVSASLQNKNTEPAVPTVSMKPLPGQYFVVSGTAYNGVDSQNLLFPNITMSENGLLVNSSIEQSSAGAYKFYYFIDTQQNYNISLNVSVLQAGFNHKSINFYINSLVGQKNFAPINIGMIPLYSIGNGFSESFLKIPGYDKNQLMKNINPSVSSDIYNKGPQRTSIALSNFTKVNSTQFIAYTSLNGEIYSKLVSVNDIAKPTIYVNTSFSTFMNISAIGQFYSAFNARIIAGRASSSNALLIGRLTSNVNISLKNMLNYTADKQFGKIYGKEFNLQLPWKNLAVNSSSSGIALNESKILRTFNGTFIVYNLPGGNYNFTYKGSSYVRKQLDFIHNNKTVQNMNFNISAYGLVLPIRSLANLSFNLTLSSSPTTVLMNGAYTPNKSGTSIDLYLFKNLTGVSMDYRIRVEGNNFTGSSFNLNYKSQFNIQYINVSNTNAKSIFNETGSTLPNHTSLWNNSVYFGKVSGIIQNVTVKLKNNSAYTMLNGTRLEINNQLVSELKYNSSSFNNLKYSYLGGAHLKVDIYLGGVPYSIYTYFYVYFGILNVNYANMNGVE